MYMYHMHTVPNDARKRTLDSLEPELQILWGALWVLGRKEEEEEKRKDPVRVTSCMYYHISYSFIVFNFEQFLSLVFDFQNPGAFEEREWVCVAESN